MALAGTHNDNSTPDFTGVQGTATNIDTTGGQLSISTVNDDFGTPANLVRSETAFGAAVFMAEVAKDNATDFFTDTDDCAQAADIDLTLTSSDVWVGPNADWRIGPQEGTYEAAVGNGLDLLGADWDADTTRRITAVHLLTGGTHSEDRDAVTAASYTVTFTQPSGDTVVFVPIPRDNGSSVASMTDDDSGDGSCDLGGADDWCVVATLANELGPTLCDCDATGGAALEEDRCWVLEVLVQPVLVAEEITGLSVGWTEFDGVTDGLEGPIAVTLEVPEATYDTLYTYDGTFTTGSTVIDAGSQALWFDVSWDQTLNSDELRLDFDCDDDGLSYPDGSWNNDVVYFDSLNDGVNSEPIVDTTLGTGTGLHCLGQYAMYTVTLLDGIDDTSGPALNEITLTYAIDLDGDGWGVGVDLPPHQSGQEDCDDSDALIQSDSNWYADCDNDGITQGTADIAACTEADALLDTTECAGNANGGQPYNVSSAAPATADCDDDAILYADPAQGWYADCDNDGITQGTADIAACTEADALLDTTECAGNANGNQPYNVSTSAPATADCDDDAILYADPAQGWYADCDNDGVTQGTADIAACTEADALLDTTECAGNANGNQPYNVSTSAPGTADCDDDAILYADPAQGWYADCDNDGVTQGTADIAACTEADALLDTIECAGNANGNQPFLVSTTVPATPDCNDNDIAVQAVSNWYADCDNDGITQGTADIAACTEADALLDTTECAGNANGGQPYNVSSAAPATADCDDDAILYADPAQGWYADCDNDGITQGTADIAACTEADALLDTTECAGNANGNQPYNVSTSAPATADCDDDAILYADPAQGWYADCDNDGITQGTDDIAACTEADALLDTTECAGNANGGQPYNVSTSAPGTADCDDDAILYADPSQGWYADCDGDGITQGTADIAACTEADALLDTTECAGNLNSDMPFNVSTTAPATEDCNDDNVAVQALSSWYADCDGDGITQGTADITACTEADALLDTTECAGNLNSDAPYLVSATPPATADCDDDDILYADPAQTWYADCDGDGITQGTADVAACTEADALLDAVDCAGNDNGDEPYNVSTTAPATADCDDNDILYADPAQTWYADCDGDGFTQGTADIAACTLADALTDTVDCAGNDNLDMPYDANRSPPVTADCDDFDDAYADPNQGWYADCDGDGVTQGTADIAACTMTLAMSDVVECGATPAEVSTTAPATEDCDDADPANYPGNVESCDGQDNDCNFMDDVEGYDLSETDNDGDGRVECDGDCDDTDANNYGEAVAYPAAGAANDETCEGFGYEQTDNDCDTDVNDIVSGGVTFYADCDGDGFGDPLNEVIACEVGTGTVTCDGVPIANIGWVLDNNDCDDLVDTINPNEPEECNSLDDDCDNQIDEPDSLSDTAACIQMHIDEDKDGYGASDDGLCLCANGADVVEYEGDDYVANASDCDDVHSWIKPHECNDEIDNDDDDALSEVDDDDTECQREGRPTSEDPDVDEQVWEVFDGHDNDCDGYIPLVELDCDMDGAFALLDLSGPDVVWEATGPSAVLATDVGLEMCSGEDLTLSCWSSDAENLITVECDLNSGFWVADYTTAAEGLFDGAYRNVTNTAGCESYVEGSVATFGDCDDQCASRCPGVVEECDGVDNDCDIIAADPTDDYDIYTADSDADGIRDVSDPDSSVPGYVASAEFDVDADGYHNCDEDFSFSPEQVQTLSNCTATVVDGQGSDCDDLCYLANSGGVEVCNGFLDVCDAPSADQEGTDSDGDLFAPCGTYGPASQEFVEQFYVPVWVNCEASPDACEDTAESFDDNLPSYVPLIPSRAKAKTCDTELDEALDALLARVGSTQSEAGTPEEMVLAVCPGDASNGFCTTLKADLDMTIADEWDTSVAVDAGNMTQACAGDYVELTPRTVWTGTRLGQAREGVVALECLRLYGKACSEVENGDAYVGSGAPENIDDILDDTLWVVHLARFLPSTINGAMMMCWGDPTVSNIDLTVGGDCDDSSTTANRDEPEGPADLINAFTGKEGDCALCRDQIDNNCDGKTDCEDPSCAECFVGQGVGCTSGCSDPCAPDDGTCNTAGQRGGAPFLLLLTSMMVGLRRRRGDLPPQVIRRGSR